MRAVLLALGMIMRRVVLLLVVAASFALLVWASQPGDSSLEERLSQLAARGRVPFREVLETLGRPIPSSLPPEALDTVIADFDYGTSRVSRAVEVTPDDIDTVDSLGSALGEMGEFQGGENDEVLQLEVTLTGYFVITAVPMEPPFVYYWAASETNIPTFSLTVASTLSGPSSDSASGWKAIGTYVDTGHQYVWDAESGFYTLISNHSCWFFGTLTTMTFGGPVYLP